MKIRFYIFVACLFICSCSLFGQSVLHFNPDSLYARAREYAYAKQYFEAKRLCRDILGRDSLYFDVRVLLGRIYAWDKQYDSARMEFQRVLQSKKTYWDALDGMTDLETWTNQAAQAIKYCDTALSFFPNDKFFLIKRAKLNIGQGNFKAASGDLFLVLQLEPSNDKALALSREIKQSRKLNKIELGYNFDFFEKPWIKRWHLLALGYSRTTKIGVFTGRVLVGDIIQDNESFWQRDAGFQVEVEAYPKIIDGSYLYLAYAFSPDSIFPQNRAGLEWFQRLPHHWEVSLGGRYMLFPGDTNNVGGFFTLTGSAGFYFRNFWLSFRPYLTFLYNGVSQSYNLEFRTYFRSADQFLSVLIGYGNSVDDPRNFLEGASVYNLSTVRIRLAYRQLFLTRFMLEPFIQYQYEEYVKSSFRSSWSLGLRINLFF